MNDQAQQQLAAIHERHEKATADAIETFKQRHPHWNIPTEDEIASCYEAYFGDGEVKFLLALLADAERERDHYNEEAKHAWGNVKIFQDELTKVQQLLAAANERAEQAAAARQAEIVSWLKQRADDQEDRGDDIAIRMAAVAIEAGEFREKGDATCNRCGEPMNTASHYPDLCRDCASDFDNECDKAD